MLTRCIARRLPATMCRMYSTSTGEPQITRQAATKSIARPARNERAVRAPKQRSQTRPQKGAASAESKTDERIDFSIKSAPALTDDEVASLRKDPFCSPASSISEVSRRDIGRIIVQTKSAFDDEHPNLDARVSTDLHAVFGHAGSLIRAPLLCLLETLEASAEEAQSADSPNSIKHRQTFVYGNLGTGVSRTLNQIAAVQRCKEDTFVIHIPTCAMFSQAVMYRQSQSFPDDWETPFETRGMLSLTYHNNKALIDAMTLDEETLIDGVPVAKGTPLPDLIQLAMEEVEKATDVLRVVFKLAQGKRLIAIVDDINDLYANMPGMRSQQRLRTKQSSNVEEESPDNLADAYPLPRRALTRINDHPVREHGLFWINRFVLNCVLHRQLEPSEDHPNDPSLAAFASSHVLSGVSSFNRSFKWPLPIGQRIQDLPRTPTSKPDRSILRTAQINRQRILNEQQQQQQQQQQTGDQQQQQHSLQTMCAEDRFAFPECTRTEAAALLAWFRRNYWFQQAVSDWKLDQLMFVSQGNIARLHLLCEEL